MVFSGNLNTELCDLHQRLPWVDRLGEPGLDGLNSVGVATGELLDDVPGADTVGAEAVQDGGAEKDSEGNKCKGFHMHI